jgi:hypothetical protein
MDMLNFSGEELRGTSGMAIIKGYSHSLVWSLSMIESLTE